MICCAGIFATVAHGVVLIVVFISLSSVSLRAVAMFIVISSTVVPIAISPLKNVLRQSQPCPRRSTAPSMPTKLIIKCTAASPKRILQIQAPSQ
jgi:hypothetical protein